MIFDVMTLFPELIETVTDSSILGIAKKNGLITVNTHQIRDYSNDKHRRVDDTPYGGGKGMLMRPDPIVACHRAVKANVTEQERVRTIYLSPQGQTLTQAKAQELASYDRLILLCGHYEGIDQRAIDSVVEEEISIGDYVLTGGELPACILIDCVSRLLDGVLTESVCFEEESFSYRGILEYPQYTRPVIFEGQEVPAVLRSGNHKEIEKWRWEAALEKTKRNRPDLIKS